MWGKWRKNLIIKIREFGIKNRELISYVIFGVTTTAVNIIIFQLLYSCGIDYKWANLVALILGKAYAYVTNKLFVFRSHCDGWAELMKEFIRFVVARGVTGLVDYFGMIIAVEVWGLSALVTKYFLQILIIILNYVFSKWTVFIKKSKD